MICSALSQLSIATIVFMENPLVWALVLLGVAVVLLVAELLLPSAGILTGLAVVATVAALVLLWQYDTKAGLVGTIIVVVLIPFAVGAMLHFAPRTPIARWMGLTSEPSANTAVHEPLSLVDHTGVALTDLRPVGICLIDDQRIECISEAGLIQRGQPVRVTAVEGFEVRVRHDA